jgi:hypothetical protein
MKHLKDLLIPGNPDGGGGNESVDVYDHLNFSLESDFFQSWIFLVVWILILRTVVKSDLCLLVPLNYRVEKGFIIILKIKTMNF